MSRTPFHNYWTHGREGETDTTFAADRGFETAFGPSSMSQQVPRVLDAAADNPDLLKAFARRPTS